MEPQKLDNIYRKLKKEVQETTKSRFDDLTVKEIYEQHAKLLVDCGTTLLTKEYKRFMVDENNKQILRYLLYYFNNCPLADEVFPDKNYSNKNNLLICGEAGAGKTMLFQVFAKYLEITHNPNAFVNLSVTQMINYYKINNHLDKFTYNEQGSGKIEGNPFNVCMNDIGLQSHLHFGTDTKVMILDFFHARNEIWVQSGHKAHATTNMTRTETAKYFYDEYGRLTDRLKTYNLIYLKGESRR